MFQDILETDLLKFQICWNEQIDYFSTSFDNLAELLVHSVIYHYSTQAKMTASSRTRPRRSLRILRNWVLEEGGSRSYFQSAQKYERLGGSPWQLPPAWLNLIASKHAGFWSWKIWMCSKRDSGGDFQKSDSRVILFMNCITLIKSI